MAREYSKVMYSSIKAYCKSQGWQSIEEDDDAGCLSITFRMKNKLQTMNLNVYALANGICAYGTIPFSADKDTMVPISEFVARANYGLNYGNFELDHRDGELRFKSSIRCKSGKIDPDDVEFIVDMPIHMWDQYGNALLQVLIGGAAPEKAVEEAEK